MNADKTDLIAALRGVPLLQSLPDEELEWVAGQGEEYRLEPGAFVAHQGEPPSKFCFQFTGQTEWTTRVGAEDVYVLTHGPGSFWGYELLMTGKQCPVDGRVVTPVHLHELKEAAFWQFLGRYPQVLRELVTAMADRWENLGTAEQQHLKLISLGTMAAGLAHELNNPAAAGRRAAGALRDNLRQLQPLAARLGDLCLTPEQRAFLEQWGQDASERAKTAPTLDGLARSDREEELGQWLDDHDVEDGWELAPALVEAGVTTDALDELAAHLPAPALCDTLTWLSVALGTSALALQIEQSTGRISELVQAVKQYSYMDQPGVQDVDIHEGIESVLTLLAHKRKRDGITIEKQFDSGLPRIPAHGSALNQIWMNLLDNALDAVPSDTGSITISTTREASRILVEIRDNGPGIPPDILGRIWEPFFTTKPVGKGTGLGLEISRRVAGQHHGDIRVTSEPGDTRFQVRLPVEE